MFLDCSEIISGRLWVGCHIKPEDVGILRQMGITSILNLQSDWDLANYGVSLKKLVQAYLLEKIDMRRIPIPDFDRRAVGTLLPQAVDELENALAPLQAKVYVHCTAGINRGPTLAAAYLIKAESLTAREAYNYVIARRDCSPYLDALQEYEASLNRKRLV